MSAQPSVPTPPALEGEETGPNYGQAHQGAREQAAVEDRGERQALQTQPQLNGVDPRRGDVVREGPPRAEPRITGPPDEGRIQAEPRLGNGQRVNGSTDEVPPALPLADQTTALSPGSSAGYESIPTRVSSPVRREYLPRDEEPHRAERTVAMEYSFQQAAGQPAVRWVARLTEFLRSSTRANGFQGRFLEGLGLGSTTTQHPQNLPTLQQQQSYQQAHQQLAYQQQAAAAMSPTTRVMRPQDLQNYAVENRPIPPPPISTAATPSPTVRRMPSPPPPPPPAPVDGSPWSQAGRVYEPSPPTLPATLFTSEQVARLGRFEREAPLLYRPPSSTSSEEVQAEVQRQLRDYVERHDGEAQRLKEEIERLQMECERLSKSQHAVPGGDRATTAHYAVPGGDRATTEHYAVPGGDRATTAHYAVPGGDRATSVHYAVPGGDRATTAHYAVPGGDRATTAHYAVPGGDRATSVHYAVPGGDRATSAHYTVPGGDRATSVHYAVPGGDRATTEHYAVPGGDRATTEHYAVPGGDRTVEEREDGRGNRVPVAGGDPTSRDLGARRATEGSRGTTEYFDLLEGDKALREDQQKATVVSTETPNGRKEEPTKPSSSTPSTMELLGVIATGMRQLQEVQLRQLEKRSDVPEVVKPGISSLPTLSQPGQDTSPVDIQDWLEEAGSVMTDLSDSSWEWWLQVKDYAEEHYKKWVRSTPMEKISLAMPKNASLEQGRYGRVNARAAGMVLAALSPEVKSEMITKKVTGSTLSLILSSSRCTVQEGRRKRPFSCNSLRAPRLRTRPRRLFEACAAGGAGMPARRT